MSTAAIVVPFVAWLLLGIVRVGAASELRPAAEWMSRWRRS